MPVFKPNYGIKRYELTPPLIKYLFFNKDYLGLFLQAVSKEIIPTYLQKLIYNIREYYNKTNSLPPEEFIELYVDEEKIRQKIYDANLTNYTFFHAKVLLLSVLKNKYLMLMRSKLLEIEDQKDMEKIQYTYKYYTEKINELDTIDEFDKAIDVYDDNFEPDLLSKLPTGFTTIDKDTEGGLPYKGLGIIIAASGIGKSTMLINLAVNSYIKYNKNVLYLNMEGQSYYIRKRAMSIISQLSMEAISTIWNYKMYCKQKGLEFNIRYVPNTTKYERDKYQEVIQKLKQKHNKFKVLDFPAYSLRVEQFKEYINKLIKNDRKPDVIYVDYADLFKHKVSADGYRFALKNIYFNLLEIATTHSIPIWTASQTNRKGVNKEIVDMDAIREDFSKIDGASIVISLSRKDSMSEIGLINAKLIKVRDGRGGRVISFKYDETTSKLIEETIEEEEENILGI